MVSLMLYKLFHDSKITIIVIEDATCMPIPKTSRNYMHKYPGNKLQPCSTSIEKIRSDVKVNVILKKKIRLSEFENNKYGNNCVIKVLLLDLFEYSVV